MSDVATTIQKQIRALDPLALLAWGARKFVVSDDSLSFEVSGATIKRGRVQIKLNVNDLYDVTFVTFKRNFQFEQVTVENVFVEDLVTVIDNKIG